MPKFFGYVAGGGGGGGGGGVGGCIKLPLSEGNSWNKIPFLTIFYHLNFSCRIRADQIMLARTNIP